MRDVDFFDDNKSKVKKRSKRAPVSAQIYEGRNRIQEKRHAMHHHHRKNNDWLIDLHMAEEMIEGRYGSRRGRKSRKSRLQVRNSNWPETDGECRRRNVELHARWTHWCFNATTNWCVRSCHIFTSFSNPLGFYWLHTTQRQVLE